MKKLVLVVAVVLIARWAAAEIQIIKGGESTAPEGERSQIILGTRDRTVVPATTETRETKTETGTRSETITRLRDAGGDYFEWQRATDVVREVSPGKFERTTEVIERDRQGGERERKLIQQSTDKTETGERSSTLEYRRDSSGNLVRSREEAATITKNLDGTVSIARTESDYDINGRPVAQRQIEGVTTTSTDGKTQTTTSTTRSVDHLHGGNVGVTARETVVVQTEGNTTRSETVTQRPVGASWENTGRTVTTETRANDGTIQRETLVEGRSLYARQGGRAEYGDLVPQSKIVERQVRQSDGTTVIQRDLYRRDVNGDWKPTTFSTEAAQLGY
jgi:hypothetical protein